METESDAEIKEILQAQRDLFDALRELHVGRKAIGHKRIDEMHEQISGLESQIKSQREQLALLAEELEAKVKLVERGMLPRPEYLALRRLKAEIEGEMAENTGNIARTRETIGETRLQIVNQDAVRLDEIVSEMAKTRSELDSVEQRQMRLLPHRTLPFARTSAPSRADFYSRVKKAPRMRGQFTTEEVGGQKRKRRKSASTTIRQFRCQTTKSTTKFIRFRWLCAFFCLNYQGQEPEGSTPPKQFGAVPHQPGAPRSLQVQLITRSSVSSPQSRSPTARCRP